MKIQRFDCISFDYPPCNEMRKADSGDYVLFSDHEKIVGELAEMLKEIDATFSESWRSDSPIKIKISALLKKHDL